MIEVSQANRNALRAAGFPEWLLDTPRARLFMPAASEKTSSVILRLVGGAYANPGTCAVVAASTLSRTLGRRVDAAEL